MKSQSPSKILLSAIVLMAGTVGFAQAQGSSSIPARSEEALLLEATQKALAKERAMRAEAEAEAEAARKQVKALGLSLAEANRLANDYREDYNKLRLQTEAFGLDTLTRGDKGTRERLLKAISDRRLLEDERDALADALLDLSDAVKSYMTTAVSSNVETRAALQSALNGASKAIGLQREAKAVTAKKSLDEGKIVTIQRDYGILVFNLGSADGAKIGMPFAIYRKDRAIGSAMIVDVRNNRCGALITNLIDETDDAQVGDRVKVQTQKNL